MLLLLLAIMVIVMVMATNGDDDGDGDIYGCGGSGRDLQSPTKQFEYALMDENRWR